MSPSPKPKFPLLAASLCALVAIAASACDSPETTHFAAAAELKQTGQRIRYADIAPLARSADHLEEFLDLLASNPATSPLFERFVMVYAGGGAQRGNLDTPRVILLSEDAGLIVSYPGLSTNRRAENAEVIEFQEETRSFKFIEVKFENKLAADGTLVTAEFDGEPMGATTLYDGVENELPRHCGGCHRRSSARPNWESYPLWPGFFGGIHDLVYPESIEYSALSSLAAGDDLPARYSHLSALEGLRARFAEEKTVGFRTVFDAHYRSYLAGNENFTEQLALRNFERIARLIKESPQHDEYRYALIAAMVDCEQGFENLIPADKQKNHPSTLEELVKDTRDSLSDYHDNKLDRLMEIDPGGYGAASKRALSNLDDERDQLLIARLRFLLENRVTDAHPVADWSMTRRRSYAFASDNQGIQDLPGFYFVDVFAGDEKLGDIHESVVDLNYPGDPHAGARHFNHNAALAEQVCTALFPTEP